MSVTASDTLPDPSQQTTGLKPYRFRDLIGLAPQPFGWAIAAAIGSAALGILPFWFISRIAEALLQAQTSTPDVLLYISLALASLLFRWLLMALSHMLAHSGAFTVQHRLRLAMAGRLGRLPLSFFPKRGSGSLSRTLNDDVSSLEGFLAHMLPDAVAAATVPLAAIAVLLAVDWRLTLAAIAPLPLALAAQMIMMSGSAERLKAWQALQKRIFNQVAEYVRGIHVIKAFGLDASSFSELASSIRAAADWVADYAKYTSKAWVIFATLLSVNLMIVAPFGAWLYSRSELDTASFLLFLLVAPNVLQPLLRLTFAIGEQQQRTEALARINEVLEAAPLAEPAKPLAIASTDALGIEFIQLSHRYHDRIALDQVSFDARAGQLTAIVGPSGSGKSTLLKLLARQYEIDSGSIRVGPADIREWQLDQLLGCLSSVFQEVVLFDGSIRDNLLMANPAASDSAIQQAARAARADDFISAMPNGYQTRIGERGARLSGGQRQRLSIARALLKNAPILLLDEATVSIDAHNEALIQQALAELCRGRTVLMVAHRLHTIMHADQIIVLDQGRVVGTGQHAELLSRCSCYKQLWHDHERARNWSMNQSSITSTSTSTSTRESES